MYRARRWVWVCCLGAAACVDTEVMPPRRDATDAGPIPIERARGPEKPPLAPARPIPAGAPSELDAGASPPSEAGRQAIAMKAGAAGATPTTVPTVPTVQAVPTPSRAGQLVITELMIDPQTLSDSQGEWIELHNPTDQSFELRGCELDDGAKAAHPVESSLEIKPAAFVTIARHAQPGFTPDRVLSLSLTNSGDSVALRCAGQEIDRVTYDKTFPLQTGASLSLDPAHMNERDNDRPEAWCAGRDSYGPELGTPGARNPSCDRDADAGAQEPEGSEGEAP